MYDSDEKNQHPLTFCLIVVFALLWPGLLYLGDWLLDRVW